MQFNSFLHSSRCQMRQFVRTTTQTSKNKHCVFNQHKQLHPYKDNQFFPTQLFSPHLCNLFTQKNSEANAFKEFILLQETCQSPKLKNSVMTKRKPSLFQWHLIFQNRFSFVLFFESHRAHQFFFLFFRKQLPFLFFPGMSLYLYK